MVENNLPISVYISPLVAGGLAGLTVDVVLYPIDTLKTRLQSVRGFSASGGFRGIYRGLNAVVAGSMPTSALFFASYELVKKILIPLAPQYSAGVHMLAASIAEVVACLVRVPTEIVKQRQQTASIQRNGLLMLQRAYREEGIRRGVYRGFFSTVMRDLPFSFIQMPIWEYLKSKVRERNGGRITSLQGAFCGSVAGSVAGAMTTPLDVAKTRIMLAEDSNNRQNLRIVPVLKQVFKESGLRGVFSGLTPRIAAFTTGGFLFFGAYDYSKSTYEDVFR